MKKYIQIALILLIIGSSHAAEKSKVPGPISIQEARQLGADIEAKEDAVMFRGKKTGFIHYKMSLEKFTGCEPEKVVAQAFSEGTSLLNARLGLGDGKYEFSVDIERPDKSRLIIFCKSGGRAGYVVVFK